MASNTPSVRDDRCARLEPAPGVGARADGAPSSAAAWAGVAVAGRYCARLWTVSRSSSSSDDVAGRAVEAQQRVARRQHVARASRAGSGRSRARAPVARTPASPAQRARPRRGRVVRDHPARQQVRRRARAIDPDRLARRLVERHERIQQRRRRLAVRRLQRVARPAAGQPDAHEALVVVLADRLRDLQVARLLEAGRRQRQPGRRQPRRRRSADHQLADLDVDELAQLVVALPEPHERVRRVARCLASSVAGAPVGSSGSALDQRELLDQNGQRVGAAPHEVPAPRVLVDAGGRGAPAPRRRRRGAKPSSYQVLPSEIA